MFPIEFIVIEKCQPSYQAQMIMVGKWGSVWISLQKKKRNSDLIYPENSASFKSVDIWALYSALDSVWNKRTKPGFMVPTIAGPTT